ncbi:hypothetical protein Tco_0637786 [Tanacetum coccineum]
MENAANVIGLLGCDPESVEHMIDVGVCSVFDMLLKEGLMKVQTVVAWADSELVKHYPKCQNLYAQHNFVSTITNGAAFYGWWWIYTVDVSGAVYVDGGDHGVKHGGRSSGSIYVKARKM